MPMSNKGLSKLAEELGELVQVVGKKLARMDTDEHWDGKRSLKERMEEEMADVQASIDFVCNKLNLDKEKIAERRKKKFERFTKWDNDPNS